MNNKQKENALAEKSYQFTLKIVFVCKELTSQKEYTLSKQLLNNC